MTQCERCSKRDNCKTYQESLNDTSKFLFGCSDGDDNDEEDDT